MLLAGRGGPAGAHDLAGRIDGDRLTERATQRPDIGHHPAGPGERVVLTRGGRTPTHDPAAIIERERAAERPAQGAEIGDHTVIPESCMAVRSGAHDLAGLIDPLRRHAESRRHPPRPA